MEYDYVAKQDNNTYGFKINDSRVEVYVNDKYWGIPQGDHFILVLLNDLLKLNSYHTL